MEPKVYFYKRQMLASGKAQNLFFLYGGKDQKNIVQYLDQNQILIGIDYTGRDGREIQTKTVEAFGEMHMQQILNIQPQGPFYICGFSFGGLVAFEIAQRFNKLGHKVDMLMLIDTFPPDSIREISGLEKVDPPTQVYSMAPRKLLGRVKKKTIRFLNWKYIGHPNKPLDFLCKVLLKFNIPIPGKRFISHYTIRTWKIARSQYKIETYDGNLTYFKASTSAKEHEKNAELWQSVVLSDFKVYTIPGEHLDLIKEPSVKILSHLIKKILNSYL